MSLSKDQLIERLGEISSRYDEVVAIREKMDRLVLDDNYQRKVILPDFPKKDCPINKSLIKTIDHTSPESATKNVQAIYEKEITPPKKPQEPKKEVFKAPSKPSAIGGLKALAGFALAVCIFFLLGSACSNVSETTAWTIPIMYIIAGIALVVSGVSLVISLIAQSDSLKKEKIAHDEFDREQEAILDKYNEQLSRYEDELEKYKQGERAFLNEYLEWREIYLEHLDEEKQIKALMEEDKQKARREIEANELLPALALLHEENDLVADEYLSAISQIKALIQNGRADSLKEAINLYEELLYKERQLTLMKEQEEQRQRQEEIRRQEEQQRHNEEMMLLRAQEYQRQLEESYRRQEQERRHREEMERLEQQELARQRKEKSEEARRQHDATAAMYAENRALHRQCNSCANMSHCSMAFRRPNCASYKPK